MIIEEISCTKIISTASSAGVENCYKDIYNAILKINYLVRVDSCCDNELYCIYNVSKQLTVKITAFNLAMHNLFNH